MDQYGSSHGTATEQSWSGHGEAAERPRSTIAEQVRSIRATVPEQSRAVTEQSRMRHSAGGPQAHAVQRVEQSSFCRQQSRNKESPKFKGKHSSVSHMDAGVC